MLFEDKNCKKGADNNSHIFRFFKKIKPYEKLKIAFFSKKLLTNKFLEFFIKKLNFSNNFKKKKKQIFYKNKLIREQNNSKFISMKYYFDIYKHQ